MKINELQKKVFLQAINNKNKGIKELKDIDDILVNLVTGATGLTGFTSVEVKGDELILTFPESTVASEITKP
jgi:hypothetical protein